MAAAAGRIRERMALTKEGVVLRKRPRNGVIPFIIIILLCSAIPGRTKEGSKRSNQNKVLRGGEIFCFILPHVIRAS